MNTYSSRFLMLLFAKFARSARWPALAMAGRRQPAGRCQLATVAVGVSGGVDSSVAALLLKQQGHDVVGIHMSNWDHEEEGSSGACSERELEDARLVCERLGIGFHPVSFVREYWTEVFEPFVAVNIYVYVLYLRRHRRDERRSLHRDAWCIILHTAPTHRRRHSHIRTDAHHRHGHGHTHIHIHIYQIYDPL